MVLISALLAVLLAWQRKKACNWSSTSCSWQSLQSGEEFSVLVILFTRSCVGRRLWRSFHKKVLTSEPRPLSLASLQVLPQSFSGHASSAREGRNCLVLAASGVNMVMLSSTRREYHWLLDIVATFKGELSCTCRIVSKNCVE